MNIGLHEYFQIPYVIPQIDEKEVPDPEKSSFGEIMSYRFKKAKMNVKYNLMELSVCFAATAIAYPFETLWRRKLVCPDIKSIREINSQFKGTIWTGLMASFLRNYLALHLLAYLNALRVNPLLDTFK